MSSGDHVWARRMQDALFPELPEDFTPAPNVQELEEQFADGYSYAPDGCRVEMPATRCEHGQEVWASILGMQDEGEVDDA